MLRCHNLTKRFNDQPVLLDIGLEVPRGSLTVLIGPSGCGKSTLLRHFLGLLQPDAGSVTFDGQPLTVDRIRAIRHRIGYVIQDGGLFPHLTAAGNITLLAKRLRKPQQWINDRLASLRELTHFPEDALTRYPYELSGGQRQRVALMRALLLDPDVLLLDEPLGALDPLVRSSLQDELRDMFRELGKTIVLVTHDLAEAAFFSEDIVLMRDGRILQRGSLHEMITSPADPFVGEFIRAQRAHQVPEGGR
ncbi:ATP-binding cassette domain-containing protein [bacterium]|nr:ATP-binding cassette domain-containing protein [bacterium]